jgi:hypothetical protein
VEDTPELLALCDEFDQASIARGILGMGFLTGKCTLENYRRLVRSDLPIERKDPDIVLPLNICAICANLLSCHGEPP